MHRRAIFLDRDGVLNRPIVREGRPYPPQDLSEFEWMDGVHETLRELRERGYLLLVFTNQPDVARGTLQPDLLASFHERILTELPIDRIYTCTHDDADGCDCRKPKPGMLFAGQRDYELDLASSWVVGDRWRDIDAGRSAGCRTVLVRHDYRERRASADYEIDRMPELLRIVG